MSASGNKLILWTCRVGDALEKAVSWCLNKQLELEDVSDNLPQTVELYGKKSWIITYDYYIDNKTLLPETLKA